MRPTPSRRAMALGGSERTAVPMTFDASPCRPSVLIVLVRSVVGRVQPLAPTVAGLAYKNLSPPHAVERGKAPWQIDDVASVGSQWNPAPHRDIRNILPQQ